ncbi:MAG TPA: translation initiation factor [Opitutae bacterium]|nr:translation initiation factor [Opitutae bacterium]|tara:strand:- start:957 stop:1343 length:387 start_codon:yes stop_codon:yes gene_type:complete
MTAKRISTEGESSPLEHNPFASLQVKGPLKDFTSPQEPEPPKASKAPNRGRVDIRREKSGRGGKVVTVITGFQGMSEADREKLLKRLKNACATGGAVKGQTLELQGDQRERVAELLSNEGFRPVFAGG